MGACTMCDRNLWKHWDSNDQCPNTEPNPIQPSNPQGSNHDTLGDPLSGEIQDISRNKTDKNILQTASPSRAFEDFHLEPIPHTLLSTFL